MANVYKQDICKCEIQIIIECKAARVIGLLDPALTLLLSHDTPLVPRHPPIQHPTIHPPFFPLRARDPLPPPPPRLLLSLLFSRDQDAVCVGRCALKISP